MTHALTTVVVMAGWAGLAALAVVFLVAAAKVSERDPDESPTRRFFDLGVRPEHPEWN